MSRGPEQDETSGCWGKQGYLTWDAANKTIARNRFRPKVGPGHTRVMIYRCRFCAKWHIGSGSLKLEG